VWHTVHEQASTYLYSTGSGRAASEAQQRAVPTQRGQGNSGRGGGRGASWSGRGAPSGATARACRSPAPRRRLTPLAGSNRARQQADGCRCRSVQCPAPAACSPCCVPPPRCTSRYHLRARAHLIQPTVQRTVRVLAPVGWWWLDWIQYNTEQIQSSTTRVVLLSDPVPVRGMKQVFLSFFFRAKSRLLSFNSHSPKADMMAAVAVRFSDRSCCPYSAEDDSALHPPSRHIA
jgi:hypothetical protein